MQNSKFSIISKENTPNSQEWPNLEEKSSSECYGPSFFPLLIITHSRCSSGDRLCQFQQKRYGSGSSLGWKRGEERHPKSRVLSSKRPSLVRASLVLSKDPHLAILTYKHPSFRHSLGPRFKRTDLGGHTPI